MICCSARQQTIDGSEHENSCMLLTTKRHGEDGQEQTKRSASRRRRRRHYGRRSGDESRTLATAVLPTGRIPRGLVMFDDDGMQRHDELYIYTRARAPIFRGYCGSRYCSLLFLSIYIYIFCFDPCFQIRSCRYVCVFYSSVRFFFCSPI